MKTFTLDMGKYGLEYLKSKHVSDWTDDEIDNLTDAFAKEMIAPNIPGIMLEPGKLRWLSGLGKCKKCARCCRHSSVQDDPGVLVMEGDLAAISKRTKHSMKSLRRIAQVNDDPTYEVGALYLPRPCTFFDANTRRCKVYS